MSESEKQEDNKTQQDYQETLDKLDNSMRDLEGALGDLKSRIEPRALLKTLTFQIIYNTVFIIGVLSLITYIWGPMPWLWITAGIIYICLIGFSIFAYLKAKKAYAQLEELPDRLNEI